MDRSEESASNDSLPWIFLSHSGRQKPFVTRLYHALLHAKHRPFFDLDTIVSLPIGLHYPSRIFQACRACKMGIVVLSKAYVESLWPMAELQHLLQNSSCLIYPLFYDLQPSDLSDPKNVARWEECWAEEASKWQWERKMQELHDFMSSRGCDIRFNLDKSSWTKNLKELQYTSGEVYRRVIHFNNERTLHHQSEHEYIQAVVSNICTMLPSPHSLDNTIKGGQRIHWEIAEFLDQKESLGVDGVHAVGVHGIGGSGKTTLCKVMATFYSDEFCGRCCHLEFPTNDNEVEKLLWDIKAILPRLNLHSPSRLNVSNIDQAMNLLEEGLQRTKVFLAMDNVWGHSALQHRSFEYAQRTMLMKFMPGSKILVTGRSKEVLTCLLQSRLNSLDFNMQEGNVINQAFSITLAHPMVVHIPSLNELEAVKILKSYSPFSYSIPDEDEWRSLARSCVFEEHCHPLCLKLKGVELQKKGRAWFNDQECKGLFLSLKGDRHAPNPCGRNTTEEEVLRVVEKSFNVLPLHLQGIFIDLATAWMEIYRLTDLAEGVKFWNVLGYFTDEDYTADGMFYQVLELEYHGLLELKITVKELEDVDYFEALKIHDLHRMLAESKASHPRHAPNALINHVVEGDLSGVSSLEIASKKLVYGHGLKASKLATLISGSRKCPIQADTRVLYLHGSNLRSQLNLEGGNMKALRVLHLSHIRGIRAIDGWDGVSNLVRLDLHDLAALRRIGGLGCLKRLETLSIERCENLEVEVLVGDHNSEKKSLVKVGDHLPKLEVLHVRKNRHLVDVGSTFSDTFPALKILRLTSCDGLEKLPGLKLASLRTLDLADCHKLKSILEGGVCFLPALLYLDLDNCIELERLPDLSSLVSLRSLEAGGTLLDEVALNMRISEYKPLKDDLSLPQFNCSATDGLSNTSSAVSLLADVLYYNDLSQQSSVSDGDVFNYVTNL